MTWLIVSSRVVVGLTGVMYLLPVMPVLCFFAPVSSCPGVRYPTFSEPVDAGVHGLRFFRGGRLLFSPGVNGSGHLFFLAQIGGCLKTSLPWTGHQNSVFFSGLGVGVCCIRGGKRSCVPAGGNFSEPHWFSVWYGD